jgi:hypothetical protein
MEQYRFEVLLFEVIVKIPGMNPLVYHVFHR